MGIRDRIYTPSTKAEIGDHDENISYEQSIAHLEKYFPGKGEEYAKALRDNTIALYKKCAEYALSLSLIHISSSAPAAAASVWAELGLAWLRRSRSQILQAPDMLKPASGLAATSRRPLIRAGI